MNHFSLSVEPKARSGFTSTLYRAGIFIHTANLLAWRWLDFMVIAGTIVLVDGLWVFCFVWIFCC